MCLWYIFTKSRPEFLKILLNWDNKIGVDTALRQTNKTLIDVFFISEIFKTSLDKVHNITKEIAH